MRAFVTGASGFIGQHLVKKLLQSGWTVRALIHKRPLPETAGLESVKGDINNRAEWVDALEKTDVVFHLAAALGGSLLNKKDFQRINTEGTKELLEAAKQAGVQMAIHVSSAGVLGSVRAGQTADESYPPHPQNVYDRTKLDAEKFALQKAKEGMSVAVVRPGWVYGPGDRRTFKLVRSIARKRFVLVTRGTACQTPVHIDDLIQGIWLCTEKARSGEVYHLAGKEVLTVRQIVESIASATERSIPKVTLPLFPVRVAAWKLEKSFKLFDREAPLTRGKLSFFIHPKPLAIEKSVRELGYTPKIEFKTGIAETVHWYREQGWL
jgi:nucleoside-diphosphate-sugar epimerase